METNSSAFTFLYLFLDQIVILDRPSSAQYAQNLLEQTSNQDRRLVLWVDASVEPCPPSKNASRLSTSVVAYFDPSLTIATRTWKNHAVFNTLAPGSDFALEAEFLAIQEALRIACELNEYIDHLIILSDCQTILRGLQNKSNFVSVKQRFTLQQVNVYASALHDLGVVTELRWVPAHAGLEGNEMADDLARRLRRCAQHHLAGIKSDRYFKDFTITSGPADELSRVLESELTRHRNGVDAHTVQPRKTKRTRTRTEQEEVLEAQKKNKRLEMITSMYLLRPVQPSGKNLNR